MKTRIYSFTVNDRTATMMTVTIGTCLGKDMLLIVLFLAEEDITHLEEKAQFSRDENGREKRAQFTSDASKNGREEKSAMIGAKIATEAEA